MSKRLPRDVPALGSCYIPMHFDLRTGGYIRYVTRADAIKLSRRDIRGIGQVQLSDNFASFKLLDQNLPDGLPKELVNEPELETLSGIKGQPLAPMMLILGSPRSGTSLLMESLNLHEQVLILNQSAIVGPLCHLACSIDDPRVFKSLAQQFLCGSQSYSRLLGHWLSPEEIEDVLVHCGNTAGELLSALFKRLATCAGKAVAGDKTPDDLLSIRKLEEASLLECDIRIIHIVRDVRAVIASLLRTSWAPKRIEQYFPRTWGTTNLHLHEAMAGKPTYHFVNYEKLVTSPESELRAVIEFLGLSFDKRVLSHGSRAPELRNDGSHTNLALPFLSDRASAWNRELSPQLKLHCEASAGEGLHVFGYL